MCQDTGVGALLHSCGAQGMSLEETKQAGSLGPAGQLGHTHLFTGLKSSSEDDWKTQFPTLLQNLCQV